jgi:hypothetical protein
MGDQPFGNRKGCPAMHRNYNQESQQFLYRTNVLTPYGSKVMACGSSTLQYQRYVLYDLPQIYFPKSEIGV